MFSPPCTWRRPLSRRQRQPLSRLPGRRASPRSARPPSRMAMAQSPPRGSGPSASA